LSASMCTRRRRVEITTLRSQPIDGQGALHFPFHRFWSMG
jgi:hypothetical protein